MSNQCDEKIFEYLTKEENFSTAYEVAQAFGKVKDGLIEEFWKRVEGYLDDKKKDKKKHWDLRQEGAITSVWHAKLGFWFAEGDLRIIFEDLKGETYCGLWINDKTKKLDKEKISERSRQILGEIKSLKRARGPTNWWLIKDYIGINFTEEEHLKKIFPHNRDNLALKLAKTLFDFAEEMDRHIIEMSKMTINQVN